MTKNISKKSSKITIMLRKCTLELYVYILRSIQLSLMESNFIRGIILCQETQESYGVAMPVTEGKYSKILNIP